MFSKKSLVLLGTKNKDEKAVMTLEKDGDMFAGRVRLYNFSQEPRGILSIGFYNGEKVVKSGLSRTSSMLYTFRTDVKQINDNFSCAVINFSQGDMQPILYGNTEGVEDKTTQLAKVMNEAFEGEISIEKVTQELDKKGIEYDEELREEIDKEIDKNLCGDCSNCKYRRAFFENENEVKKCAISNEDTDKSKSSEDIKKTFFEEIRGQIDKLFDKNEKEEILEEIIPNSKWVKVEYEDDGDYYILGLIYQDEELKYIVYGVPGIYQKVPPKEISGYPVWFPLDKDKRESFGYWLSYQDAETGESIKAIVE